MDGAPAGLTWVIYTDSNAVKQDEEDIVIIKSHAMRVVHRQRHRYSREKKQNTQKILAQTLRRKVAARSLTKGSLLLHQPGTTAYQQNDQQTSADEQCGLRRVSLNHSIERTHLTKTSNDIAPISKALCQPGSTALTLRAFQYFCETTIPCLLYVNPSPSAYYLIQCLMPQAFNVEPAITHSIVATAAAQELALHTSISTDLLAAVSIKHYGESLHTLANKIKPPTRFIALISCFLFIGYETFQNAPEKAALHLRNALRILREWKQHLFVSNVQNFSSQDQLIRQCLEPVFAHLEAIFSMSSVSAINAIGDLEYAPPAFPERFQSLLEVRGKMLELVIYFLGKHPPESITAEEQLQLLPMWQNWFSRLSIFTQDLLKWPIRNQLYARLLHVHADMLAIALQCQRHKNETVWDEYLDRLQNILTTCYDICHRAETYQTGEDPNDMDFGITLGVLPPLWLIGMICRDPITRRRAIELLRIHHRRCGHTDECSAVVLTETVMRLEEEGIPLALKCNDIPERQRVRALESDLTQPGKLVLTFARPPYTVHSLVHVPYMSTTPLPVRTYRLWPIVGTMTCVGYHGLIRPKASSCICKAYGQ